MTPPRGNLLFGIGLSMGLGTLLLALSMLRIWGDAGSAAFSGKVIEATMAQPIWGTALAWHLLAFATALLFVHFVFGIACLAMAKVSRIAWPDSPNSSSTWIVLWFVFGALWILIANATLFPWSSLGEPYAGFALSSSLGLSPLLLLSIALLGFIVLTIGTAGMRHSRSLLRFGPKAAVATLVMCLAAGLFAVAPKLLAKNTPATSKPNVILIGIDSLRVDAVTGADSAAMTPAIHAFLTQSAVFTNTTTPLARTFPSWVSIISGRSPHTTGAVINLFPRDRIAEGETLPKLLKKNGYKTVYAIDEVRFSNLDKSYGFDDMIAPPIGSADFILGFFSDTPLSNLLVNTRIGALLFPYAHANRAAAVTYEPNTLIERLDRDIIFDQPTLLAVHLTLAHWPFSWASSEARLDEKGNPDTVALYKQAVRRVDQQFSDLLALLRSRGALDNAIVVVLSDHGESLGEEAVTAVPDGRDTATDRDPVYGHGTDVLADHQYRVVLGMQMFGAARVRMDGGQSINIPASLEDVTPTLADALGLQPAAPYDGISLLPFLEGSTTTGKDIGARIRFAETEFNPFSIGPGMALSASALRDATEYYRIDPETDRVMVREEFVKEILANRQYAASRGDSILASIPVMNGPGQYLVFIERTGALPTWIDSSAVAKSGPEVTELWHALREKFPATRSDIVLPPGLQPPGFNAHTLGN